MDEWMNGEKQHINLHLDAHTVSLDVPREIEPVYRNAAEWLNARYKKFLQMRPKASAEQLWMYTALEAAVRLHSDIRDKSLEPVEKEITELNNTILRHLDASTSRDLEETK